MARDATRRRVLTAAAAALPLVAAGCKGISGAGHPAEGRARRDRGHATPSRWRRSSSPGTARCWPRYPALAGTLRPLLAQHHDHLARLRARLIVPAGGQPLPSPRATPRRTAAGAGHASGRARLPA